MANDVFPARTGFELLRAFPVGSGVAIAVGEMIKMSGGKATPVTTSTDNLTFIARAVEAHGSTDRSGEITVAIRNANAIYEYELDAATDITVGDELQINTSQKLKKSSTDPVAVAVDSKLSATSIRCIFTIPAASSGLTFLGDAS